MNPAARQRVWPVSGQPVSGRAWMTYLEGTKSNAQETVGQARVHYTSCENGQHSAGLVRGFVDEGVACLSDEKVLE